MREALFYYSQSVIYSGERCDMGPELKKIDRHDVV